MKTTIIVLFLALMATSCKKKYEEGFNAGLIDGTEQGRVDGYNTGFADGNAVGHAQGYSDGYAEGNGRGYTDGYAEGKDYFSYAGFDEGYADGEVDGTNTGFHDGYANGYNEGYDEHYVIGYNDGKPIGYSDGLEDGYNSGYSDGSYAGYNDGYDDGYDDYYGSGYNSGYANAGGYSAGYNAGYNNGFDDGYDDGSYDYSMGLSAKSNNPAVKLAAMVNQDLIDYSKLQKFDSSTSGSFVLSHGDIGTVDMEKLASLKEQYFLNQMSKQIKIKFGLSDERAKEIAVVAHQFNKTAGMRELTEKDADIFAKEVIGADLNSINDAVTKSLKGDSQLLDKMLVEIADHNQTSPENVNRIIMELFF